MTYCIQNFLKRQQIPKQFCVRSYCIYCYLLEILNQDHVIFVRKTLHGKSFPPINKTTQCPDYRLKSIYFMDDL